MTAIATGRDDDPDWAPGPAGTPVNSPGQCAQIRPELGVYVLGAIAAADRAAVNRHLASCPRCREEVTGLAGLPALLRKVPVADAMDGRGNARPITAGRRKRSWMGSPPGGRHSPPTPVGPGGSRRGTWPPWRPSGGRCRCRARRAAAPGRGELVGRVRRRARRGDRGERGRALHAAALGDRTGGQRQRIRPGTPCQIWATTASGQQAARRRLDRHTQRPARVVPRSVPFPAASLVGFHITAHGNVLVTILLRPGPRPTPAHASSVPPSIPVT